MSDFNPESFMQTQMEGDFTTTEITLPDGEYSGTIDAVSVRVWQPDDGGPAKPILQINWRLDGDRIEALFKQDSILADQRIFLTTVDGTPNGPLDKEHNQQLARTLQALNMLGNRWSPEMFVGKTATVKATTREGTGEFEGQKFYRVNRVIGQ